MCICIETYQMKDFSLMLGHLSQFGLMFVLLAVAHSALAADNPLVLDVWPGKVPGDSGIGQYGPIGSEHVRDPNDAPTKTAKWITGVTRPTITVYRPQKGRN